MINIKLLLLLLGFLSHEDIHKVKKNLKVSVIIPCHPKHACQLNSLLTYYENQTVLPNEVVISLSEIHKVEKKIVKELKRGPWKFPVILITSQAKLYAGQNRNVACLHATGDVFISQDADDIPHPQRVEIIKYFFSNYRVDHLMHQFGYAGPHNDMTTYFPNYNVKNIPFVFPKNFKEVWNVGMVTNGNIAISRTLFNHLHWLSSPRGQDVEFNSRVYNSGFSNRILIKGKLLAHRAYLSTTRRTRKSIFSVWDTAQPLNLYNFIY